MEFEITEEDLELVEAAKRAIGKNYKDGWHAVGAAIRTRDGTIFTGIHLEANVGRIAVCAEPIAVANAIMAGRDKFDTIVAVLHPNPRKRRAEFRVCSPCGMCRELVTDYDPETKVIIRAGDRLKKMLMSDLLPYKYSSDEDA